MTATPAPPPAATPARAPGRTLSIGGTAYPLILPSLRDPRLHVAAVIISVHVLGQVGLGFWVSVPQILAAILTTAILEVAITFRQVKQVVWPASAMLTGSGVALILRAVGTPPDDHWSLDAVPLFATVAGLSLLSKYVIRYRGSHVFNPSNIGLVIAFVVLGSSRVEPLDFWWAPLNVWMIAAYAVILVGGLLITRRLKLLALAASFWITLTVLTALLSASGHCMTTNWSFTPVCGADYWRVIVTSPEVLIFLFFMITDPKTVPAGAVGRVVFGALVAIVSSVAMAPQTNEFGAKVALLSGLFIVSAGRPILDRLVPVPGSAEDDPRAQLRRLSAGASAVGGGALRRPLRVALIGVVGAFLAGGIVLAGAPARGAVAPDVAEVLAHVPRTMDASTFPTITVKQNVGDFDPSLVGPGAQELVLTTAQNLEIENEALLRHDGSILPAVDHGGRLIDMRGRLSAAAASGVTTIVHYRFDAITMSILQPFGRQTGLSIGLDSTGQATEETYDSTGALTGSHSAPFAATFVIRRATGARWLNVA